MCPSHAPTCSSSAMWKLGLVVLSALLPMLLLSCASTKELAQELRKKEGTFLTPLASRADAKTEKKTAPLKLTATVPEENLEGMRGCLGVYYFNYDFDINLVATPQVKVTSTFQAVLPDGSPAPTTNGTQASFKDSNVSFSAGPTSGGLASQLVVTGQNNIVFANSQFNIHIPNASTLTSTVNVLPAASLSGIGVK
jgi:hypothetical protein